MEFKIEDAESAVTKTGQLFNVWREIVSETSTNGISKEEQLSQVKDGHFT